MVDNEGRLNHSVERLKFFWKDNKVIAIKYFIYSVKRLLVGSSERKMINENKDNFEEFTKGKTEIVKDINYSNEIRSKIILPTADKGLTLDLFTNNIREPREVELMIKEVKNNMNIIDIGANLGYYVLLEGKITKGKIYAIEPNPLAFEYLKRSVEINNFKNVELFNIGIGSKKESLPFYISKNWNWSRFNEDNDGMKDDIIKVLNVDLNNLDNLFGDREINLIRMDVEGYEKVILPSLNKILKNSPHLLIFMEYHSHLFNNKERKDIVNWIKNNNFKVKYLTRGDKFKKHYLHKNVNPNKLLNLQTDYCVVLERKA